VKDGANAAPGANKGDMPEAGLLVMAKGEAAAGEGAGVATGEDGAGTSSGALTAGAA